MKKSDIKIGGMYRAKISGNIVTVQVDRIEEYDADWFGKSGTRFHVTNLVTGRKTTFRSAAKFRRPAGETIEQEARRKAKEAADERLDRAGRAAEAHDRRQDGSEQRRPLIGNAAMSRRDAQTDGAEDLAEQAQTADWVENLVTTERAEPGAAFYDDDQHAGLVLAGLIGKQVAQVTIVEDGKMRVEFTDGTIWMIVAGECQAEGHLQHKVEPAK